MARVRHVGVRYPIVPFPLGRDLVIERLQALCAGEPAVTLTGRAGIGKTTVARACFPGATYVSLAGCLDEADAVRAIGFATDAQPIGDERSVLEALGARAPVVLIADDVGTDRVYEFFLRLPASVVGLNVLVVGEVDTRGVGLELGPMRAEVCRALGGDPLDSSGSPFLAIVHAAGLVGASAASAPGLAEIAYWSMGVPGPPISLPPALVRSSADRSWIRRAAVVHALTPPVVSPARAASFVWNQLGALWGARREDRAMYGRDPKDILLLRALAPHLTSRARALALLIAARLLTLAGQVDAARQVLTSVDVGSDRALMEWADADVLFASGDVEAAIVGWQQAAERLRRAQQTTPRLTLLRRAADTLAGRGDVVAADRFYREARTIARLTGDERTLAATLRGAADLAITSGEVVSAATLQEQAETDPHDRSLERVNLRLGQAGVAMVRGEHTRAARLLQSVEPLVGDHLLARANLTRRRADLLLRRGETDAAMAAATEAYLGYERVGQGVAQAATVRLGADILAVAGSTGAAVLMYERALALQIRAQDLRGIARTLAHFILVEESRGRPNAAERRRDQRHAVLDALGES